jgi:hypothetical protein
VKPAHTDNARKKKQRDEREDFPASRARHLGAESDERRQRRAHGHEGDDQEIEPAHFFLARSR